MTFGEAVKAGFQNYVNFTGRAMLGVLVLGSVRLSGVDRDVGD
jgi:hypothetical protein